MRAEIHEAEWLRGEVLLQAFLEAVAPVIGAQGDDGFRAGRPARLSCSIKRSSEAIPCSIWSRQLR